MSHRAESTLKDCKKKRATEFPRWPALASKAFSVGAAYPFREAPHLLTRERLLQFPEQLLVRWVKAEPLLAASDQRLALGHSGIVHARLTSQGNRYRVAFGVFRITFLHVIQANRHRNIFGFVGIYDRQ